MRLFLPLAVLLLLAVCIAGAVCTAPFSAPGIKTKDSVTPGPIIPTPPVPETPVFGGIIGIPAFTHSSASAGLPADPEDTIP
jgi:hypothetical protein